MLVIKLLCFLGFIILSIFTLRRYRKDVRAGKSVNKIIPGLCYFSIASSLAGFVVTLMQGK